MFTFSRTDTFLSFGSLNMVKDESGEETKINYLLVGINKTTLTQRHNKSVELAAA
jgi:hypothetical protein